MSFLPSHWTGSQIGCAVHCNRVSLPYTHIIFFKAVEGNNLAMRHWATRIRSSNRRDDNISNGESDGFAYHQETFDDERDDESLANILLTWKDHKMISACLHKSILHQMSHVIRYVCVPCITWCKQRGGLGGCRKLQFPRLVHFPPSSYNTPFTGRNKASRQAWNVRQPC